jgi:phytanoyl-CoA hydroxylase
VSAYLAYREPFERDGYVVVPGFVGADTVGAIHDNVERYARDTVGRLPFDFAFYDDRARPQTLRQLNNMQLADPFFAGLFGAHPWSSLAAALLGEDAVCDGMQWFDKTPGSGHATPPHQDNSSRNLDPPSGVAMWLALDPVDAENGCLRYLPGSHAGGLRPHVTAPVIGFSRRLAELSADDAARGRAVFLEPGDVVVHHACTIHWADANRSRARRRRALLQLFHGASCGLDEAGLDAYEADLLRIRRAIGVDASGIFPDARPTP